MIRVAAVGDIHIGADEVDPWSEWLARLASEADLLLLAGDLTRCGARAEAARLARELERAPVPVVAVLGNHDYHSDQVPELTGLLVEAGVRVLEGSSTVVEVRGTRVGVVGTKGFGGGFAGACGTDFGEPEMKAFIHLTRRLADALRHGLGGLDSELKIALLHYSPVPETLEGERPEIYPFLGSYLLAEAVDGAGAHLVLHGHAHRGREVGLTPGGIPVRNVARQVIGQPYKIYSIRVGAEAQAAGVRR